MTYQPHTTPEPLAQAGYWCLHCGRELSADDLGVIAHDDVPHPVDATFDEDERPQ